MSQNSADLYKNNRFFFIIAAAKRAHALQENLAAPLIPTDLEEKSTITALHELRQGVLKEDGSEWSAIKKFDGA